MCTRAYVYASIFSYVRLSMRGNDHNCLVDNTLFSAYIQLPQDRQKKVTTTSCSMLISPCRGVAAIPTRVNLVVETSNQAGAPPGRRGEKQSSPPLP